MLGDGTTAPADHKLYVIGGQVRFIQVDRGRFGRHTRNLYDPQWRLLEARLTVPNHAPDPRPARLDELIAITHRLAEPFDPSASMHCSANCTFATPAVISRTQHSIASGTSTSSESKKNTTSPRLAAKPAFIAAACPAFTAWRGARSRAATGGRPAAAPAAFEQVERPLGEQRQPRRRHRAGQHPCRVVDR